MLTLTRSVRFCAAHRLYNPAWSEEKNARIYGRCSNPGGHGHNYTLAVTVTGPFDAQGGMIINVSTLREMLEREVVQPLDHRDLNCDVPFLHGVIPTMENLVVTLSQRLQPALAAHGITLKRITLAESDHNHVTLEVP